jgi:flagellar biosynthesis protein FliQ
LSEEQVIELVNQTLILILKVSAPMLIVSLVIGLIVSILQTITSVQEQTLTFVPKLVGVFVVIMLCGRWVMGSIVDFFNYIMSNLVYFIKG